MWDTCMMTDSDSHHRLVFSCVDKDAESVPGETANTLTGALFYHVEAICNDILCPLYDTERELTCAAYTK